MRRWFTQARWLLLSLVTPARSSRAHAPGPPRIPQRPLAPPPDTGVPRRE
jgi:hypothetical protein